MLGSLAQKAEYLRNCTPMELAASSDDKSDNVKTYIEAENDKLSQLLSLKEKTIETKKILKLVEMGITL